jgi:hypothetical protein
LDTEITNRDLPSGLAAFISRYFGFEGAGTTFSRELIA